MMPVRILVVDYMMPMRAFIKAGIIANVSKEIEIHEASSGEAAKAKLESKGCIERVHGRRNQESGRLEKHGR